MMIWKLDLWATVPSVQMLCISRNDTDYVRHNFWMTFKAGLLILTLSTPHYWIDSWTGETRICPWGVYPQDRKRRRLIQRKIHSPVPIRIARLILVCKYKPTEPYWNNFRLLLKINFIRNGSKRSCIWNWVNGQSAEAVISKYVLLNNYDKK